MKKISRTLLALVFVTLSACNRPAPQPKQLPTETNPPPPPSITAELEPTPTDFPTLTPTPEESAPQPPTQKPPQQQPSRPRGADTFPLFKAGQEFNILEIKMINLDQGWAAASADPGSKHILRTRDGGQTWRDVSPPQPLSPDSRIPDLETAFTGPDAAVVLYSGSDLIWSTTDGGANWTPIQLEFQTQGGGLLSALDQDQIWLFQFLDAGMQKVYTAVYRSADGGQSWNKLLDPFQDASIQAFDKTGAVFASEQSGWLTRFFRGITPNVVLDLSQDGGQTWTGIPLPPPDPAENIFQDPGVGCGLYQPFLASPDQGHFQLSCQPHGDTESRQDYLYKTTNGGQNWEILPIPPGDLYTVSPDLLFSAGREIQRSDDGGQTWNPVKSVNWDGSFSFVTRDMGWAVAYDPVDDEYALVKTVDGCQSFEIIRPVIE